MSYLKLLTNSNKFRVILIFIFMVFSCFLSYFFQIILNISIVYSHFFYIPIFLACFWWEKKGLIIPIFLGFIIVFTPFLTEFDIMSLAKLDNYLRACFFLIFGTVSALLNKYMSMTEELSKVNSQLKFYRDLFTHDVNNIFQNIKSSAELYLIIQEKPEKLKDLGKYVKIIKNQCMRGEKLARDVRKLSELEKEEIFLEKINAMDVLNELTVRINEIYKNKKIEIKIESQMDEVFVLADNLLSDVFENVLLNAIKYNCEIIVKILIKISKLKKNNTNYVKFNFIDNGIGITDEKKKILFKEGYLKEKDSKGMGFGLTLVKKIINSYEGKIWVEDRVKRDYSKGSIFIILIPETL